MVRAHLAVPLGTLLGVATPATAHAGDFKEVPERGVMMEFIPAGVFCMPTLTVDCKLKGLGQTGPFVGGTFNFGFRAEEHAVFGISYTGASLRPDYRHRQYAQFGHMHHALFWVRVGVPLKRIELAAEAGGGYSYLTFPLQGGAVTSQGFAARVTPVIHFWIKQNFYMGIRSEFLLNVHGKTCREGLPPAPDPVNPGMTIDPNGCIKRNNPVAKGEPLPVHLAMPGIVFGIQW